MLRVAGLRWRIMPDGLMIMEGVAVGVPEAAATKTAQPKLMEFDVIT
jgi:hypothetical protein